MVSKLIEIVLTVGVMFLFKTPDYPKFKGTREERFHQAVFYYQEKMNLSEIPITFATTNQYCASVMSDSYNGVIISLGPKSKECKKYLPEELALHEMCHVRFQHHLTKTDDAHDEVKGCIKEYLK